MNFKIIHTHISLKALNKIKKKNKTQYKRIIDGLDEIEKDPFKSSNKQLLSNKCPKCKRKKVGNYRIIYYVNTGLNIIEIQNIIKRQTNYFNY